jgi:kynurenine formamidase
MNTYVLSQDKYQIEILANLDKVPESGGIAVVSFPKPKGGSGFPARVFAIVP